MTIEDAVLGSAAKAALHERQVLPGNMPGDAEPEQQVLPEVMPDGVALEPQVLPSMDDAQTSSAAQLLPEENADTESAADTESSSDEEGDEESSVWQDWSEQVSDSVWSLVLAALDDEFVFTPVSDPEPEPGFFVSDEDGQSFDDFTPAQSNSSSSEDTAAEEVASMMSAPEPGFEWDWSVLGLEMPSTGGSSDTSDDAVELNFFNAQADWVWAAVGVDSPQEDIPEPEETPETEVPSWSSDFSDVFDL
jgi:hypothetical protein